MYIYVCVHVCLQGVMWSRLPNAPDYKQLAGCCLANQSSCWLWHQVEGGRCTGYFRFFFFQSATSGWSIKLCSIPHIALECCQLVTMHIIFTLYVLSACLVYWLLSCGSSIIIAHSQHRTNQLRRYPGPNVSVLRLKYTKTSFVLMWRPCGFFGGKLKSQLESECREECMFLLCGIATKC